MISPDDAVEILDRLASCRVEVWVDGGWGVDALLGGQSRCHDDLDLVIAREDCAAARHALAGLGYEHATDIEPGMPARFALRDPDNRRIDFHPVVFDDSGNGWQELPDGRWACYPAAGLAGAGRISERRVRCLTPELQVSHHLGYDAHDNDHDDMRRLAERFRIELPAQFQLRRSGASNDARDSDPEGSDETRPNRPRQAKDDL